MASFKGHVNSDCPFVSNFNKGKHGAWLDEYRDAACRVARYPDTSFIPGPIRAAVNVCVNKSGLSKALPNAIVEDRKTYVAKLHSAVQKTARQDKPSDGSSAESTPVEGHAFPFFPLYDEAWSEPPQHAPYGRNLQELGTPAPNVFFPEDLGAPAPPPSKRNYLESMPYNLLPIFVGFIVAGVLLPLFFLLLCIRNRKCSRRLCSCWCCIRPFFKRSRRQTGPLHRWDSNESSSTASGSTDAGGSRKLVPRRSCLGLRYVALFAAIVVIGGALGLGTYALVELQALLSQLSCSTGQAASTIINGQTFATPPVSSRPPSASSSFTDPFAPRSPFLVQGPSDAAMANARPSGVSSSSASPPGEGYWGVQRLLQENSPYRPPEEEALPKRTGFLGFAPALDYFTDLLMALDPKREDSLPKTLHQAGVMSNRITKTVNEINRNVKMLKQIIDSPANTGESVLLKRGAEEPPEKMNTYHISLVAAGAASLLRTWDTLMFLLPQGIAAIAEASDSLASNIEGSLQSTGTLPPVDQLQTTKRLLSESLAAAQNVLEPMPKLTEPFFWGGIAVFALMGSLLLLASLYLCCMCCCKREALVEKRGASCGCSFLMLLTAAFSLILSGVLLIATTAVTDGCLYTGSYVQTAGDIDNLMRYFQWGQQQTAPASSRSKGPTSSAAARVLEACLLPNKERDLIKVFGLEELIASGEKMRQLGSVVMRSEAASALLFSFELQEAAKELQLIEEAYWLFLMDPLLLEEEDLNERLFTYREVLCSGLQDKQRSLKAKYIFQRANPSTLPAAAEAGGGGGSGALNSVLLPTEDLQPLDELNSLLKKLTPTPEAAERLSVSLQQTLQEIRTTNSSRGDKARKLISGVLGEVMQLAAGKTETEKLELLKSLVRLAGKINAELEADAAGAANSESTVKRRHRRRRALLLSLLQETCMQEEDPAASESSDEAAGGRLVVFGVEDVEERVAPFSLASLRNGRGNSSSTGSGESGEPQLVIDAFFDPSAPQVFEVAAGKGAAEEQRRFVNAVWWAAKKEQLRSAAASSFCPKGIGVGGLRGTDCSLEAMQEATHQLTRKLRAQLESLWDELRLFFESRKRVFKLVSDDFGEAASNLDCTIVHNEAHPLGAFVCDKVRVSGSNVALVLLIIGCSALLLLPCFCCLWRAGVEDKWRQRDAAKRARSNRSNSNSNTTNNSNNANPDWISRTPTLLTAPMPQNNNAAAAAAVAAAAAATAAAASGLSQNPQQQMQPQQHMQQQLQQHQHMQQQLQQRQCGSYAQQVRSEDWR
ncbi:hypothetical protein Efla_003607 [Eimeria flavescens]